VLERCGVLRTRTTVVVEHDRAEEEALHV
jgi:hypothetical protein